MIVKIVVNINHLSNLYNNKKATKKNITKIAFRRHFRSPFYSKGKICFIFLFLVRDISYLIQFVT